MKNKPLIGREKKEKKTISRKLCRRCKWEYIVRQDGLGCPDCKPRMVKAGPPLPRIKYRVVVDAGRTKVEPGEATIPWQSVVYGGSKPEGRKVV